jgi:hypothetical protein
MSRKAYGELAFEVTSIVDAGRQAIALTLHHHGAPVTFTFTLEGAETMGAKLIEAVRDAESSFPSRDSTRK